MKNTTRLLAASAMLVTASHAAPFLAINDNAEIFLTGTVGVRADSNIFLSGDLPASLPANHPSRDRDDVIFEITPGILVEWGHNSVVQGSFSVSENFTRFQDHDQLNDETASALLQLRFDDGKSKGGFNASYTELNQNTVDTFAPTGDTLINREVYGVGGNAEVAVTQKTSVGLGVQYQKTEFERTDFSDSQVVTLPFNYYYELTPKVDLSLGYRFRQRWEAIRFDTKSHFFNIGARGELAPKLTGTVAVGVTRRSFSHKSLSRDSDSLLGIDTSLSYELTPKTLLRLSVSNDFDTNSQGQEQKNLAVRLGATSRISEEWSVTSGVTYRRIDYYTRVDDYFEGQIGATYIVNAHISVTGAFSYRSNDSVATYADFEGRVVSLAASFRF